MVTSSRLCSAAVAMRRQRLALLRLQLAGAVEQGVEASRTAPIRSMAPFLPMPGHAGDVVARVADERQHVDHLRRRDAELLDDALRIEPRAVLARVVHADAVADELKEVLVDRDDDHVEARRQRRARAIVPITSSAS